MRVTSFILKSLYPFRIYLLGPLLIMLIYSIDISVRPYLMKVLIDTASSTEGPEAVEQLWPIASYFIAVQFFIPLCWRVNDWCMLRFEPALKNHIAKTAFETVSKQDTRFFNEHFTGSLSAKINDLAGYIPPIISAFINHYLTTALTILFAMYILAKVHIWFTVAIFIWSAFVITIGRFTAERFSQLANKTAEALTKIMGQIVDAFGNNSSVRLFARQNYEVKRLAQMQKGYLIASQERRWFMLKFYTFQGFSFSIYQTVCLSMLIHLFGKSLVTAGDFVLILTVNFWIIDSLWQLTEQMRDLSENWGIVDQALQTLFVPHDIQDKPNAKPLEVKNGEIVFQDVAFQYKGTKPFFHQNFLKIPAGYKVGLVGTSGSGKSTFVNLILRLYDVTSGKILIDGQEIKEVTQASLRQAISMIPQDPSLFHRSIMENIRYGKLDATDQEVIEAAKLASCHEFIEPMPQKYETIVGERGVKLSGGQRQRIAIARAILKNAPILILDEATSQLDSITEKKIQDSVEHLMRDKTAIIIAHRLSTLMQMDRILVFQKGKIIEEGTHAELLSRSGIYASLWQEQVGGFFNRERRMPQIPATHTPY